MSVVNTETGELIDLDAAAAERRAERIRLRLDTIADNYAAVMPMIREAIEQRDDLALGYRSPGEYVADRFGGSLQRLGVEVRREVVRELTAAGMSTRAIAPVVGVSHMTIQNDVSAGVKTFTPVTEPDGARPRKTVTEIVENADEYAERFENYEPKPEDERTPVVGIDGKTYTKPAAPKRSPLTDSARNAGWDLRKAAERLTRIADDDRFGANKEQVATHLRSHLQFAIEVCQDVLDRIDN